MKSTAFLAAIALLAASASAPLLASERDHHEQRERDRAHAMRVPDVRGFDHGMQPVLNAADAGERAHGWRYFSDPTTYRAVVISPQGDYYLSLGRGLRWVAGAQSGV